MTEESESRSKLFEKAFECTFRKNKNKYCRYHHDYNHDTEDYFELKEEIEALIREVRLDIL